MLVAVVAGGVSTLTLGREPVTWEEITALRADVADARVPYGNAPQQFGELWLPAGKGPFPIVVIIHGGCWLADYDSRYVAPFAAAFARAGIAAWAIEYRRVGNPGGGWPGTFEDVVHAIDSVQVLAARHPLDLKRIVVVGHSAGGQLALWAGSAPRENAELRTRPKVPIRGIVALSAITDLQAYGREPGGCNAAVASLLGGTPKQVPSRYQAASPASLVPLRVPARLLHGALDPIVPPDQSRVFVERSAQAKADAALTMVEGAGHFDFFAPSTPAFKAALTATQQLLAPPSPPP